MLNIDASLETCVIYLDLEVLRGLNPQRPLPPPYTRSRRRSKRLRLL